MGWVVPRGKGICEHEGAHPSGRPVLSLRLSFSPHTGLSPCARAVFQRRTAACRQLCDPRFPPHPTCPGWDSPGHRRWQFIVSPPLPPAQRSGHAAPPDAQSPGPLRFLGRRHLTPLSAAPGPPLMLPSVGCGIAPGHELGQADTPTLFPEPQIPSPGCDVGPFFQPRGADSGRRMCQRQALREGEGSASARALSYDTWVLPVTGDWAFPSC